MNVSVQIFRQTVVVLLTLFVGLLGTTKADAQWKKLTLPSFYNSGYYLDVFFLKSNPNFGWACSLEGYVVRTTDGGASWQGSRVSRAFMESIQFLTPLIGYTSGPGGIYRSIDGGATWTDITPNDLIINPNGPGNSPWGSFFINSNNGVYLADGCGSVQRFYRTTDGGQSWNVYFDNIQNAKLSDAIIYKDGSGFAVGSGVLWSTDNYGSTWRFYSTTGARYWTEELAINGRSFLLPTSGTDCDGRSKDIGSLRFSTDGGYNYTEFQTNQNMFGSFLLDSYRGWGAGDNASVFYTEDAGRTWVLKNCGIRGDMDDIFFLDDTTGWVVGDGIYRSDFNRVGYPVSIEPNADIIEVCKGDTALVRASDGFVSYEWADGVRSQGRYLTEEGVYIVSAYNDTVCKTFQDTIVFKFKPSVDPIIVADITEICEGDSVELRLVGDYVSNTWSTSDTTKTIRVKRSGVYSVTTVDKYGCKRSAVSSSITVHPLPTPSITANRNTTICLDESVTLYAPPGFYQYEWSNGSTDKSITVNEEGSYNVTVTDEYGCKGTSEAVYVTVLDTKNKIEIVQNSTDGEFIIDDHIVGDRSCNYLTIRNVSDKEDLIISKPWFIGNVFFSVPQAQLPLRIAPQQSATIELCVSAVDTGLIQDTLVLPDTCSPTLVPVRSKGLSLGFEGISRCEVGVSALVIRAGKTYRLSAPYPVPASQKFSIDVVPSSIALRAYLYDALGVERANASVINTGDRSVVEFYTGHLPIGVYEVVVELEGGVVKTFMTQIQR